MPRAHPISSSWRCSHIHIVLLVLSLCLAALGVGGCVSVPVAYATPAADADAKQFKCPEGMSRIYVFRDEYVQWALPITLSIDDQRVGDFAAWTYAVFDLKPGSYRLASAVDASMVPSDIVVETEPGIVYYVWIKMMMFGGTETHQVDEQRGQQGVRRSKMITFARTGRQERGGQGTAWLVAPRHWVTNRHVVGDRKSVTLVGPNGTTITTRVLATDPANDLAVLVSEIPYVDASPIPLASSPPKVGERVIAIGFPLADLMGSSAKLTSGDISALTGIGDDPRACQFSAPIQPGSSGGPLLNLSGHAVGIVTSKLNWLPVAKESGAIPEGVGYAVKVAYLRPMLEGVTLPASDAGAVMSPERVFSTAGAAVFRVEP